MVVTIVIAKSGIDQLVFADRVIYKLPKDVPEDIKTIYEKLKQKEKDREKAQIKTTSVTLLTQVIEPLGPWAEEFQKFVRIKESIQNMKILLQKWDWSRMRGFYKKWYDTYVLKGNRDGVTAIFMEEIKGMEKVQYAQMHQTAMWGILTRHTIALGLVYTLLNGLGIDFPGPPRPPKKPPSRPPTGPEVTTEPLPDTWIETPTPIPIPTPVAITLEPLTIAPGAIPINLPLLTMDYLSLLDTLTILSLTLLGLRIRLPTRLPVPTRPIPQISFGGISIPEFAAYREFEISAITSKFRELERVMAMDVTEVDESALLSLRQPVAPMQPVPVVVPGRTKIPSKQVGGGIIGEGTGERKTILKTGITSLDLGDIVIPKFAIAPQNIIINVGRIKIMYESDIEKLSVRIVNEIVQRVEHW